MDDEQLGKLDRATRGIPLALRQACDIWRETGSLDYILIQDDLAADKIVHEMTRRYLRHCIGGSGDEQALFAVALSDGDPERLNAMLLPEFENDGVRLQQNLSRLESRYAALQRGGRRPQLHDEPRDFFLQHLRNEKAANNPEWLQRFNERAANALVARIREQVEFYPTLEELCQDDDYISRCEKIARHLFWVSEERALRWLTVRYLEGVAYLRLRRPIK